MAFDLPYPSSPPSPSSRSRPLASPARRASTPTTAPDPVGLRPKLASLGDDAPTLTLDRDELAASLLPDARAARPASARATPTLPVPHFRSRAQVVPQSPPCAVVVPRPPKSVGVPVGIWLFAALIAGLIAFQLAPRAKAGVEQAVRHLEGP
jgi:hypothetical protein